MQSQKILSARFLLHEPQAGDRDRAEIDLVATEIVAAAMVETDAGAAETDAKVR